jgi:PAS domain S-box-containing protein
MIPLIGDVMVGSYDYFIVVVSVSIAVLASYAALDLAEQATTSRGAARLAWIIGGGVAMGIGIWSMHLAGMLAFRLAVPVLYHWPTLLLALLVGIVCSIIALFVVSRDRLGSRRALAASVFQGVGIASLHYTAMAAMRLAPMCRYSLAIVTLSVLFAITGSLLSLRLMFLFRDETARWRLRKAASALLMGAGISVMHYTGMASVSFTASAVVPNLSHAVRITALGIGGIVTVTAMVLLGAVLTCYIDRLSKRSALLDGLFDQVPQAIALMNGDTRVVRVNREFTRVFGYTEQETQGRRISELIVPSELIDQFQGYARLVLSLGQRVDTEVVRQCKDGRRLHVLAVKVPLSVPGRQIAVCSMYVDITERRRAELELQDLSSRLLDVQDAERRHLARELHDEIGQLLTGLRLLLRLNEDSPASELKMRFAQARAIVDDLLARVHRLSVDLRPADLDQFGLVSALLTLFERYTTQTGVLINFKHQGVERRFASSVETSAYRTVQEALTNAARHAGVARVNVRVWTDGNLLNVQIEDGGRGFDPEVALKAGRSSGLRGMRERITLLGGRMTVDSAAGSGTTIIAELPLDISGAV